MRSPHVTVSIDLDKVRANAESIRRRVGVALIAVIKADAYGLGAERVADTLESTVDEFAFFSYDEAAAVGRGGITLGPPDAEPHQYAELGLRPAIGTFDQAERYAGVPNLVNLDTGMQRFGCPPAELPDLLRRASGNEVFSHSATPQSAQLLADACRGLDVRRHAASTSLLASRESWLDAVRPGLALYAGALRVTTHLITARETKGKAGYSGFVHPHVGVIPVGYAHQMRPGLVRIADRVQRVLEVGMNTSYVTVEPGDRTGDEVLLLGEKLTETDQAAELGIRPHEALCRFAAMGVRRYLGVRSAATAG